MRQTLFALTAVFVTVLLVSAAAAQPPGGQGRGFGQRPGPPGGREMPGPGGDFRLPPHPLMIALDADRDGELSAEEIEKAQEALKTLDTDADGKLSRQELLPQFRGPGGPGPGGPAGGDFVQRIMGFDADGDGRVTQEELPQMMRRMLQRADADGDGAIDRAEAEAAAGQFGRGVGPGRGPGRGGPQAQPGGRPQRPQRPQ